MTHLAEQVQELVLMVGGKLTAYILGTSDPAILSSWAEGTLTPSDDQSNRIQFAHTVVKIIHGHFGSEMAQAWLQGMNPDLDDQAPAVLLRGDFMLSASNLMSAAHAFTER